MEKQKIVVIVGPTGVGKTSLGIAIAKRFNGEVISGDSMQIYRGMDIGTAKVTIEEQDGVPHHLIDIKNPEEAYSAADFQQDVKKAAAEIASKGKLPIIVGGTGLYIQAALYGYDFSEAKRDETYQQQLEEEYKQYGAAHLHHKLKELDPDQADKIHPNNVRRVIRALEIYGRTGKKMSAHAAEPEMIYDAEIIGLEMDRDELYERINHRVDVMMEQGLEEEVRSFYKQGLKDAQSMRAIGYKEFIPYFEDRADLEQTIELLKRNSRRYAKRQFTWFRNKLKVKWYDISFGEKNEKIRNILDDLAGNLQKK